MWDPSETRIWGALDEGCNSTCHSTAWGRLAEKRLKALGLSFPWVDSKTKSFAGLGSTSNTLGKRRLPLSIAKGDTTIGGVLESHEIDTTARNPLLLSLFAQSTLGLIKDMKTCTCSIRNHDGSTSHVPLARCHETGLLLLCFSTFSEDLPDCVRELKDPKDRPQGSKDKLKASEDRPRGRPTLRNKALTSKDKEGSESLKLGTSCGPSNPVEQGTSSGPCKPVAMVLTAPLLAPVPDQEGLVNGCLCSTTSVHFNRPSDQWPSVLVLTGGAKYQFDERGLDHRRIHSKEGWECSIPPAVRHFKLHLHDLRSLSDPNNDSACTGRRQEILNQILDRQAGRALMSMIFRDIERAVNEHRPVIVMPYCTSNRRRSVAMGMHTGECRALRTWCEPLSWSHAC